MATEIEEAQQEHIERLERLIDDCFELLDKRSLERKTLIRKQNDLLTVLEELVDRADDFRVDHLNFIHPSEINRPDAKPLTRVIIRVRKMLAALGRKPI